MIYNPFAPDYLLSALSVVGSGSYSIFRGLANQVFPEMGPAGVNHLFYLFASLGHIDVSLTSDLRPQQWNVTPPTLCFTNDHEGWLTGFRSPLLVSSIAAASQKMDAIFDVVNPSEGTDPGQAPTSLCLLVDQKESVLKICEVVNQEIGENFLGCSFNFASNLASVLPPLDSVLETCQRENGLIPEDIQSFTWENGKTSWNRGYGITLPGLYRYQTGPITSYILFYGEERIKVNNRVGKHMASRIKRIPIITYDEDTEMLGCPQGSELPGLYERAAVLSSGYAPEIEWRGNTAFTVYKGVSPFVASALYQALYGI